jgi:Cyclin, N-terminal domain
MGSNKATVATPSSSAAAAAAATTALHVETTRDQIHALLHREVQSHYQCVDYMAHERPSALDMASCSSILEECSNVVFDRASSESDSDDDVIMDQSNSSSNSSSRSGVIKVQSSLSIRDVKDLDQSSSAVSSSVSSSASSNPQSFTFWRQQMFDWACMVVDGYGIERETVAVSFNLLDRFVAIELAKIPHGAPPITRDDYQLFAMTCLFIAIKVLETFHKKLPVQIFVDMSKNYYSKEVIEATERDILHALQWYVHAPTALSYARLLLQLFDGNATVHVSRRMQAAIVTLTELAVSDSFFVACRPSTIGLAAVLHAARMEGYSDAVLQQFHSGLQEATASASTSTKDCAEFRTVYRQLEKLYYH